MSWLQVDNRRDLRRYAFGGFGADVAATTATTPPASGPIVAPAVVAPQPAMNPVLAWLNAKRQLDSFKSLSAPKPAAITPVPLPVPLPAPAPAPVAEEPRRRRGGGMGMGSSALLAGGLGLLGGIVLYQAFGRRR